MAFSGMEVLVELPRAASARTRGRVRDALIDLPEPETASERAAAARWMMGVKFQSFPLGVHEHAVTTLCGANVISNPVGPNSAVTYQPFRVDASYTCSVLQADFSEMVDDLIEQGDLVMDSVLAQVLATALGAITPAVTAHSTTKPPLRGLAAIDDSLDTILKGGAGRIWTSAEVLAEAYGYVANEGPTMLSTLAGVPIAVDAAFDQAYNGASNDEDSGFIWGTGPVVYATTPWQRVGEDWENFNYATDVGRATAQAFGIVAFDSSTVTAQKVCLSTCPS